MDYKLHETHGHLDLLLQRMGVLNGRDAEADGDFDRSNFDEAHNIATELLRNHGLFIQPTVSTNNFVLNEELWKEAEKIKLLIGSHPEIVTQQFEVGHYLEEQNQVVEKVIVNPEWRKKIIGLGECGLDYYYSQDKEIKRKQWELFEAQLNLATKLDLPIVIHCRDAFDDLFSILSDFPQIHNRFDIHCFTGDKDTARRALEYGAYFGIGGIVTFKNGEALREAVEYIPLENILIETDLPFLAPIPHRGKDCLPEYIDDVATVIAEIKNIVKTELWIQLRENTDAMYRLTKSLH